MKGTISMLFLLMLFISCSTIPDGVKTDEISDIFPGVYITETAGLYTDRDGNTVNDHLTAHHMNGSVYADLTFSEGLITHGFIRLDDGTLHSDYSMADGLNYHMHYRPNGEPQSMVVYKENYSNRTEFYVWHENGTPLFASNQSIVRLWFEDGRLRMDAL